MRGMLFGAMALIVCGSVSCTSTTVHRTGEISQRLVSETKEMTAKPLYFDLTQKPTPQLPLMKFTISNPNIEYMVKRYEKLEKVEQTTGYKHLTHIGWVTAGVGLLYLFANPAPDPAKYGESEYNSLSDQRLKARQMAFGLLLAGGGMSGARIIKPDNKVIIQQPITRFEERTPLPPPSPKTQITVKIQNYKITDSTDDKGEGSLKIDELLKSALFPMPKWPDKIEFRIGAAGLNDSVTNWSIEEAVAFMTLGQVNWSKGKVEMVPYPEGSVEIGGTCKADEDAVIKITVSNKKGKGDCYRLKALIRSEESLLNKAILIGNLKAGEEKEFQEILRIPRQWLSRDIPFRVSFEEFNNYVPNQLEAKIAIQEIPRPAFAYACQIVDDGTGSSIGNADGRIQKGESVDLSVSVKNIGKGPAKDVAVLVETDQKSGIEIPGNLITITELAQNAVDSVRFNLVVKKDVSVNDLMLKLVMTDGGEFTVSAKDQVKFPLDKPSASAVAGISKNVSSSKDVAEIRSGLGSDTPLLALTSKGAVLEVVGQLGDWFKIKLSENSFGWIQKQSVRDMVDEKTAAKEAMPVVKVFTMAPPDILLIQPDNAVSETSEESLKLSGIAANYKKIKDIKVLLDDKPLPVGWSLDILRKKPSGQKAQQNQLARFDYRFPLNMGANQIKVIALNDEGVSSDANISVTRLVKEKKGSVYVLIVGISNYEDPKLAQLPFAEDGARAVYEFFAKNPKSPVKEENISMLIGKEASADNIKRALSDLTDRIKEKDTVLLYYAGYNGTAPHPQKGTEYFIFPYDTSNDDLFVSSIELPELQKEWESISSTRKIFISDYSNSYGVITDTDKIKSGFERGMGSCTFVISAADKGQKALELADCKRSLFAYYLLEGLNGAADKDGDARVTVSELEDYIKTAVPKKAEELGSKQMPVSKVELTENVFLTN